MKQSVQAFLQNVKQDLEAQQKKVEEILQNYPDEFLYCQPSPGKWNVLECLEHLNLTYDYYLPQIKKGIERGKHLPASASFQSGWFGKMMTNSMQPKPRGKIGMKTKTFQKTTPRLKEGDKNRVVNSFLENQQTFLSYVEKASTLNLEKIKVVSLIGPILKFKLGDAFQFLTAHNNRHFLQMENALREAKNHLKLSSLS